MIDIALRDDVKMEFRLIPSGLFRMGSRGYSIAEEPAHVVRITQPFFMGTFPVTQAQFAVWSREAAPEQANHFEGKLDCPAENMDWNQAMAFTHWLNDARGDELPDGYVATLPTEAEWEYACRAGTDSEYYTGDGEAALREAGWFGEEWEAGSTRTVGGKPSNAFGLHDMHGNVWEWCADVYDADAYAKRPDGVADPGFDAREPERLNQVLWAQEAMSPGQQAHGDNPDRVVRGGSWGSPGGRCRSACRYRWGPAFRDWDQGFRVCLVPGPGRAKGESGKRLETEPGRRPWRSRKARSVDLGNSRFPPRSGGR